MRMAVAVAAILCLTTSGAFAKLTVGNVTAEMQPGSEDAARQREAEYFRAPQAQSASDRITPWMCTGRAQTMNTWLRQRQLCN